MSTESSSPCNHRSRFERSSAGEGIEHCDPVKTDDRGRSGDTVVGELETYAIYVTSALSSGPTFLSSSCVNHGSNRLWIAEFRLIDANP